MNKILLKILISTLILLIGIGAVNAIECNSTDESITSEQFNANYSNEGCDILCAVNDDSMSVSNQNTEALSAVNDNENACDMDSEVLCAVNDDSMSVSNQNTEVLSAVANNEEPVLTSSLNEDEIFDYSFGKLNDSPTESKSFLVGTMKLHKKYWKSYLKHCGHKKTSKKFKKMFKKKLKTLKKSIKKKLKKLAKKGWFGSVDECLYDIKHKGKYYVFYYYATCYR